MHKNKKCIKFSYFTLINQFIRSCMVLFILYTSPCSLELGHGVKERVKFNTGLNLIKNPKS